MPRRSVRNLFRQLSQLGVDASGKGATVSDEVGLTYQLDNLSPARSDPTVGYVGVGVTVIGVAGRVAIMELEVTNTGGILLDAAFLGSSLGGAFGGALWTTTTPVAIAAPLIMTPELRQGRAHERVDTIVRTGTALPAVKPAGAYRFVSPAGAQTDTFFALFINGPGAVGANQLVYLLMPNQGVLAVIGMRWRELADPDNMP